MPLVQQLYEKYQNEDLAVITINISGNVGSVTRFMSDGKYTFPALIDGKGDSVHNYHIQYVPMTFFIDKDGFIRDKAVGGWNDLTQIEERLAKILS